MKPRPDFTHTYHHIVIQGLEELSIFDSEFKRDAFLSILKDVHESHDLSLYAFDFVDSHTHQFIRRNNQSMARFYQRLKQRYTEWYNAEFDRERTIYGGRYFNSIVDSDEYFRSVWTYVQNQGVDAGLYNNPKDSPWSTASFYMAQNDRFEWIDWEEAVDELGVAGDELKGVIDRSSIQDWFDESPPRKEVRNQHFIAGDAFIEKYMQIRKSEAREQRNDITPVDWQRLLDFCQREWDCDIDRILEATKRRDTYPLRCGLAYAGRKFGHLTTSELGDKLGVSQSTISRMIHKTKERYEDVRNRWNRLIDD